VRLAVDWDRGISDAWSEIARAGPKLGVFVGILTVGVLGIRVLARLADRILGRAGADALLDECGLARLLRRPAADLRTAFVRLAAGAGGLLTLHLALAVFGDNPADDTVRDLLLLAVRIIVASGLVALGSALATAARRFVTDVLQGSGYAPALSRGAGLVVLLVAGKAALDEVGVATSVTTPILYAVLAAAVGVTVVGVGGGLIRPMQRRWEDVLGRAEDELGLLRARQPARSDSAGLQPGGTTHPGVRGPAHPPPTPPTPARTATTPPVSAALPPTTRPTGRPAHTGPPATPGSPPRPVRPRRVPPPEPSTPGPGDGGPDGPDAPGRYPSPPEPPPGLPPQPQARPEDD
jgi:Conserved TM helix